MKFKSKFKLIEENTFQNIVCNRASAVFRRPNDAILRHLSQNWLRSWLVAWRLIISALRWRHNGRDSVSNHQPHDCLLNRLFRRRSKKTSKLCVTGPCAGNSPGTGEFPAQMASNAENVSIWWRHHGDPARAISQEVPHQSFIEINLKDSYQNLYSNLPRPIMMTSSKSKHYPRSWPFVTEIHRSPVDSPLKGQWRGTLVFSLTCLNKRLIKQSRRGWFESPSRSERHHVIVMCELSNWTGNMVYNTWTVGP